MSFGVKEHTQEAQGRDKRVLCPNCQEKSVVTTSNRLSSAVSDLYCRCSNPHCQAGFVMTLSHKHYTQPPVGEMQSLLAEMLRGMSREEREELLGKASS